VQLEALRRDPLGRPRLLQHVVVRARAQLKSWNGLETNYLIQGQRLVVSDKEIFRNVSMTKENERIKKTYIVQKGDSLFIISRKFPDVTVNQLKEWNNIHSAGYLKPGTKLIIKKS